MPVVEGTDYVPYVPDPSARAIPREFCSLVDGAEGNVRLSDVHLALNDRNTSSMSVVDVERREMASSTLGVLSQTLGVRPSVVDNIRTSFTACYRYVTRQPYEVVDGVQHSVVDQH